MVLEISRSFLYLIQGKLSKYSVTIYVDLTGFEIFDIIDIHDEMKPGAEVTVKAKSSDGREIEFQADCRLDTPVEVNYYRHGGILNAVLRKNLIG